MTSELLDYLNYVRRSVKELLGGALLGALGLASLRWDFYIPTWVWFLGAGLSLAWAQFDAFKVMRRERNAALAAAEEAAIIGAPTVIGGRGGDGQFAGSGGGAAYGENAYAEGGKPAESGFAIIASAAFR